MAARNLKSAFKNFPKKAKTAGVVVGALGAGMVLGGMASSLASRAGPIQAFRARGKWQRISADAVFGLMAVSILAALASKRGGMMAKAAPLLAGGALYAAVKPEVDDLVLRGTSSIAGMLPSYSGTAPGGLAQLRAVGGQAARAPQIRQFAQLSQSKRQRLSY